MKSTDFENFYKLWNTANTCLNPNYKCVNDSMEMIFGMFAAYSYEDVSNAVNWVLTHTKALNIRINEVIERLEETKNNLSNAAMTDGYNAWQIVNAVVETLGIYRSYVFTDSYIGMTLQALGWNLDYMNTLPDNEFNRNIFAKAYATQLKFEPSVVIWGNNDKHVKIIADLAGGTFRSYDLDKPEYIERIIENKEVPAVIEYAELKHEEDTRFRLELEEEERRDRELHRNSKPLSREKQEELIDMFIKSLVGRIDNIPDIDK